MILDTQHAQQALDDWLSPDGPARRYEVVTSGVGARVARLPASGEPAGIDAPIVQAIVGALLATAAGTADTWGVTNDPASFSIGRIRKAV
jgi:hypothetical protein